MSIRNFFALLFIVSLSIFVYLKIQPIINQTKENKSITKYEKSSHIEKKSYIPSIAIENSFSSDENFVLLTSFITSILSFLGFLISGYYSMINHRRKEELFNLQKEKQRLEMEKLQQEILALQKGEL